MIQQLTVYILLAGAASYVIYRIYGSVKKKQACDKCGLMEAAKKSNAIKKV